MITAAAWPRLASLIFIIAAPWASALELKTPETSGQLNRAWQHYLENGNHQTPSMQFPHARCFQRSATIHDLPVTLLMAVARGESDFNARAVSSANAIGLMQILWPGTARHLGIAQRDDLYKPCTNIDAGARYLKEMLTRYDGNLHRALAAYNYGPGRISVTGSGMPQGAQWYSSYIYRHLNYVVNSGNKNEAVEQYTSEQKLSLIAFQTPYRARAFVDNFRQRMPENSQPVRLDWYRAGTRTYQVVLLYKNSKELKRAKRWLSNVGFSGS